MEFAELERADGVRFSWNVVPSSRSEAAELVVPVGAMYSPLKPTTSGPVRVGYDALRCKGCGAALNPYCSVDYQGKLWMCPLCHARNAFPAHYAGISEQNVPAELFPQYTTLEYVVPSSSSSASTSSTSSTSTSTNGGPPHASGAVGGGLGVAYVFVVDTVLPEEELVAVAESVTQMLSLLPENANVGLVTFGTQVNVYELGFDAFVKSYCFRGSRSVDADAVKASLGLLRQQGQGQTTHAQKFLVPVSECEFHLGSILEGLARDPWPAEAEKRASRCTGAGVAVANALLGACMPSGGGRLLCFCGGPCTDGDGRVVGRELEHPIRSHKDLEKGTAELFEGAAKFYDGIAESLVAAGHVMDVFAGALDQVGLAEMRHAVQSTGGIAILTETFSHPTFKQSFQRMFAHGSGDGKDLELASHGSMEVLTSRDLRVSGCIGCCASLGVKKQNVFEGPETGIGGTSAWKLCGMDRDLTLAVFFELAAKDREAAGGAQHNTQLFVQFQTRYTTSTGESRLRVTTLSRRLVETASSFEVLSGFDQECAAVLLARLASWKMEHEEDFDATRWLDRSLIRLCQRFATYAKDDPASFQLSPTMSIFPQFMFNLRRSQFVQVFNNSPDETAFYSVVLLRENVLNAMTMIQPSLTSYSFNVPPEPALLDVAAVQADRILVLDAFFSVVLFHGHTVAQWRDAGYADQPEHAALKELLRAPREDAEQIVASRFPVPRFVDCDQHGSQARFLLVKLNPSATHTSYGGGVGAHGGDIIFTEDVSLSVFLEHLAKLSTAGQA